MLPARSFARNKEHFIDPRRISCAGGELRIMSKKDMEQAIFKVLADAWCPEDLAKDAANILAEYYPDNCLLGATEAQVNVVKQAKEYVRDDNG